VKADASAGDALQYALDEIDVVRADLQAAKEELSAEILEHQDLQVTHASTLKPLQSAERTIASIQAQREASTPNPVGEETNWTIADLKAIAQHEREQFMAIVRERDSARDAWRSTQNALGEAHLRITQLQVERNLDRVQPLAELSNDIPDLLQAMSIIRRCSTQDAIPPAP
jgi:hypothetical protein